MHNLLKTVLGAIFHNSNQFASGGMVLMLMGSFIGLFKWLPQTVWHWIVDQTTVSLTVNDANEEFDWIRHWFESQSVLKNARHLDVGTGDQRRWWSFKKEKTLLAPAPGAHWMWSGLRPINVTVTRLEDTKSGERKESIRLVTCGRNRQVFRTLLAKVAEHNAARKAQVPGAKLFIWLKDGWHEASGYEPRPLESVICTQGMKEQVVEDIARFRTSAARYKALGIPHHRGYLFEGPPGTGKTSLISGLSQHFAASMYLLKINEMSDTTLRDAVFECEPNAFIVMEDIDCTASVALKHRAQAGPNDGADSEPETLKSLFSVTQSGLLNVLDGVLAPAGVLFFMTTNCVKSLDAALIRPGRVDVQLHLGVADAVQKRALFARFFPDQPMPEEYLSQNITMAEMQQKLMLRENQQATKGANA